MVSAIDKAKRALITLLKALAVTYGLVVEVTRESPDTAVRTAQLSIGVKCNGIPHRRYKRSLKSCMHLT